MLAEPTTNYATAGAPVGDGIVLLHGATWADYQRLLEVRGERSVPRLAYLEGVLQLMSPSRQHEQLKAWIARLVEVWCEEHGLDVSGYGSWTLENKVAERGVEPDECYVVGRRPLEKDRPDLAIEIEWTRGGLDKRDLYRKLGVRELWLWRGGRIDVHALRGEQYELVPASEVLPGIDLEGLLGFLDRETMTQAMRDYRAALEARSGRGS